MRAVVALLAVLAVPIPASAQGDYCAATGAKPGSVDERECRLLLSQSTSPDPYFAATARARLSAMQQRLFDRARELEAEGPDFASYGLTREEMAGRRRAPVPRQAPRPAPRGCIMFGDGMGGGILDCD